MARYAPALTLAFRIVVGALALVGRVVAAVLRCIALIIGFIALGIVAG